MEHMRPEFVFTDLDEYVVRQGRESPQVKPVNTTVTLFIVVILACCLYCLAHGTTVSP